MGAAADPPASKASPHFSDLEAPSPSATTNTPAATRAAAKPAPPAAVPALVSTNHPAPATNALKAAFITSMDDLDDKHKLALGDHLSFRILEDREDSKLSLDPKELTVTDSGDIELPYLGRFPAEAKSCKQLAREVKAALEKDYYYVATVIIAVDTMTKTRGRVYVVGPVHNPGPQEMLSDEVLTLGKAIMRAGGLGDYADKQHVKVTRAGGKGGAEKQTFIVDVSQVLDKGKTEQDLPLEPGDLIVVPSRLIRF